MTRWDLGDKDVGVLPMLSGEPAEGNGADRAGENLQGAESPIQTGRDQRPNRERLHIPGEPSDRVHGEDGLGSAVAQVEIHDWRGRGLDLLANAAQRGRGALRGEYAGSGNVMPPESQPFQDVFIERMLERLLVALEQAVFIFAIHIAIAMAEIVEVI